MTISGYVTSVDFGDLLKLGLTKWSDGLDQLVVVTSPDDDETFVVAHDEVLANVYMTNAFHRPPAAFNKALALSEAMSELPPLDDSWILLFDADCEPHEGWYEHVEGIQAGNLYGARRVRVGGIPFPVGDPIGGFFQLWHSKDPLWLREPTLGSWHNCSGYDSALMERWPSEKRITLPIDVIHHGDDGVHWLGRNKPGAVAELQAQRRTNGGWRTERLDKQLIPSNEPAK